MNAWKGGGLYKGAPVTDEMVIAHWNGRLAQLDPRDPLYDTYKTAVMQYTYAIEESKVRTLYEQGKMTDQEVADFYLNWSKKVPQNSEFFRTLQRDAAQFLRAAQAKGAAGAKQAAEDAYDTQQETLSKKSDGGKYALYLLTMLGQSGGGRASILGQTPVTGPNNILSTSNIDELQLPSVDALMSLVSMVTPLSVDTRPESEGGADPVWTPTSAVLPSKRPSNCNRLSACPPTWPSAFTMWTNSSTRTALFYMITWSLF